MTDGTGFSWSQFFRTAGIPPSIAKSYSVTFEENRITKDMLLDLNKDILIEMGITAMGDIINIMKHAKKIHIQMFVQDAKKKDSLLTLSSKAGTSSNKPPAAHSTTPGQASSMVSTTSSSAKKKTVAKFSKNDIPDSLSPEPEPEVTYITYIEPSQKEVLFEPNHDMKRSDQLYVQIPDDHQETVESTIPTEMEEGNDFLESFERSFYQDNKLKRPITMYSDEPLQLKQPRLIIPPGEGQDIFTTSGLQKAAKVYESGEELEGRMATDRSRRLLESAGLIPSKEKEPGHSVFKRLDYKPSVSSLPSANTTTYPLTATNSLPDTLSPPPRRIINHSRNFAVQTSGKPTRSVLNTSSKRKISLVKHATKHSISPASRVQGSTSTKILVKRPTKEETQLISARLGDRSIISGLKGKSKDTFTAITSTTSGGVAQRVSRTGRTSKNEHETSMQREQLPNTTVKVKPTTMVADEYEYQTRRHRDIRSRLEIKEFEKRARRGGPLAGRLGTHKIFRRLE